MQIFDIFRNGKKKSESTRSPEVDSFPTRVHKIRSSLDRINTLLDEIKKIHALYPEKKEFTNDRRK